MYIVKNAFRNLRRSKGRSILIFTLIFIIVLSACLALSIKNSSDEVRTTTLENMSITAQIAPDREAMMGGQEGMQDRDSMMAAMEGFQEGLSLEDLETYSNAESVLGFYYSAELGLNAADDSFESYALSTGQEVRGGGGGLPQGASQGDFSIVGYSSHDAMTGFVDGTTIIEDGEMFDIDDNTNSASISQEVATLNALQVGDSFTLVNPNNEDDSTTFIVSSIFSCESTDSYANDIYISYTSLQSIVEASETKVVSVANEFTGEDTSSAYNLNISASYVLENPDAMVAFEDELSNLGLNMDEYMVSSQDVSAFEQTLLPLENLSSFTMIFFIIVLIIGGIILVIFNLFTIRERKYEIGVLAAIGMNKQKVAAQFLSEVLIITLVAVVLGTSLGLLLATPVGEVLLADQVESLSSSSEEIAGNFGGNFSGNEGGPGRGQGGFDQTGGINDVEYVDTIETSLDIVMLLQLMGLGVLLSIVASVIGLVSILRYDPLKILSERA